MSSVEIISDAILRALLIDFREKGLSAAALGNGYQGPSISQLRAPHADSAVDFDLALKELEEKEFVDTGPQVPHKNDPGSQIFMVGTYSKRDYVFLTETGYKQASRVGSVPKTRPRSKSPTALVGEESPHFYGIHPTIHEKCGSLYEAGEYAEAVEKSFKVVRDRLRALTEKYETGSEAFGKGKLHIKGAAAPHVDGDFNQAVKFLTMSIDMFRNEKSHTSDARIDDPIRAHQYLSLSSLAMYLLENAEVATG